MNLKNLIVTQHNLRYYANIDSMSDYVWERGHWNEMALREYAQNNKLRHISPLINISQFEDGKSFIHDGHHRAVATWMGGRQFLYPDEYVITKWTYERYSDINLDVGWVTPFNPRVEVRKADLFDFKRKIRELAKKFPEEAIKVILESKDKYLEPRNFSTIDELIKVHFNGTS